MPSVLSLLVFVAGVVLFRTAMSSAFRNAKNLDENAIFDNIN
jgi:hypothetical protein